MLCLGVLKGIQRKYQGKKGSKISEGNKGHRIQHVCLLKIHYCPIFLLFVAFALRNNVFN